MFDFKITYNLRNQFCRNTSSWQFCMRPGPWCGWRAVTMVFGLTFVTGRPRRSACSLAVIDDPSSNVQVGPPLSGFGKLDVRYSDKILSQRAFNFQARCMVSWLRGYYKTNESDKAILCRIHISPLLDVIFEAF